MNDELVIKFNDQTITLRSSILKDLYYNPPHLIVQNLPGKGKADKTETFTMRNGNVIDVLTSVDLQEIVKVGGKVIKFLKFTKELWNQ